MAGSVPPPRLFIGSSAEGREVARALQVELGDVVESVRWDQSVFEPGGYALDSLIAAAAGVDFAVLIATPDDFTASRGETRASPRDNIILEFGLFAGILGRDRTYLLATSRDVKLPTDVLGLTRLAYRARSDDNVRASVSDAALQVEERVRSLGLRPHHEVPSTARSPEMGLIDEITRLCANAVAQGWVVKANTATTLRLRSPRGAVHTMSKSRPESTRAELRRFAAELRSAGVRVNNGVRRPVSESPF